MRAHAVRPPAAAGPRVTRTASTQARGRGPWSRSPALAVCASHRHSAPHTDSDSIEPEDPWAELGAHAMPSLFVVVLPLGAAPTGRPHCARAGVKPGDSQEAIAAAFRATILRCHPDLHGGAPWAIAKTQRAVRAAEILRGSRQGRGADVAWSRSAAPGPLLRRGPNVAFYPNTSAFDYWASYGDREPTPEEAKRFEEEWEAAKKVAAERLRSQQERRAGAAISQEAGMRTMPFAAAAIAVAIIMSQVLLASQQEFLLAVGIWLLPCAW